MSSTARGAIRIENDFYETPSWTIRAILRELGDIAPTRILEPMAGRGAIVRELIKKWPSASIEANELDRGRFEIVHKVNSSGPTYNYDFLDPHAGNETTFDLGITNPSFELAIPTAQKMFMLCRETVLLLRLNMLGSMERSYFWQLKPADVFVLPKRPSFAASLKCAAGRACGWKVTQHLDAPRPTECPQCRSKVIVVTSDSCEYAWFVWGPGRGNRWKILDIKEDDELELIESGKE